MSQNEIPFQGPLICDGNIHRFSRDAKKNQPDEWYVAHLGFLSSSQPYLCCSYGSWRGGCKFEYKSWEDSNKVYSSVDRKELQSKIEENRRLALIEQQKRHEEAAKKAKTIWDSASSIGRHSYLEEKRVGAYGIRFNETYSLLIPVKKSLTKQESRSKILKMKKKEKKSITAPLPCQLLIHLVMAI
jgi:putative DNA primase/helicase